MKRVLFLVPVAVVTLLALIAFAPTSALAAAPQVVDLVSTTHPDPETAYYSGDPVFTWNASPGPVATFSVPNKYLWAVVVVGNYAYVTTSDGSGGGGLLVLDVSNPDKPVTVGAADLQRGASTLAVAGNHAYVGYSSGYLTIVDVSTPSAPTAVGSIRVDPASGYYPIAASGDYAYVADNQRNLQIIDVHDPTVPSFVASCDLGDYDVVSIVVAGQYAYCGTSRFFWAGSWGGLQVVDISDPRSPSLVGSCDLPAEAQDLVLVGHYAYAADRWGGLKVVDVANPASPTVVGSVPMDDATAVAVDGGKLYCVDLPYLSHFLKALDISSPAAPVVVGSSQVPGSSLLGPDMLATSGGHGYTATDLGLQVFDLAPSLGYSFLIDQSPTSEPDVTVDLVADTAHPSTSYSDLATGIWYFHVRARDVLGQWGATATCKVTIDHTPRIESLGSSTHPDAALWYRSDDPVFTWKAIAEAGTCAFSYVLDADTSTEPDTAADPIADAAGPSITLTDVPEGISYFHVRARNPEGDWGPGATFQISVDTKKPATRAPYNATATRGRTATLKYKILDAMPNEGHATVTIKVKNRAGTVVKAMKPVVKPVNTTLPLTWKFTVPRTWRIGTYKFSVYATDTAGNKQANVASNKLVVR